jgi:hypothetical protein
VSNYPIWSPAALYLDGYSIDPENALIFDFHLTHRKRGSILISSLNVPIGRLCQSGTTDGGSALTHILTEGNVSISYNAYKYKEDDTLWLGQIHISVISIKYDIEHLLKPADGDRIALQCNGAAERCQYQEDYCRRWTSGPSHRYTYPVHMIDEPIDSEHYSNPHHLLPMYAGKEGQQFELLNYRYTPPTVIPFVVRFPAGGVIHLDTVEGVKSVARRKISAERIKYQVYTLKKSISDEWTAIFYYVIVRSLVQIQLIELWNKGVAY